MPRLGRALPPPRPSLAERRALGRALRDRAPRRRQRELEVRPQRDDLVERLLAAVRGRLPALLPLRWKRMAASPFAFFRGAAALMAADIGPLPSSGIDVQVCGDAHLLNLGAYAAPDGHLVFDLNDFDETCRGPFEWDLKRLAASFVVAGREAGRPGPACAAAVRALSAAYRHRLAALARLPAVELARFEITPARTGRPLAPIFTRAARNTPAELLEKVTRPAAGGFARFRREPPTLVPLAGRERRAVLASLDPYRATLGAGRRQIFDAYAVHDAALKVVGTGSIGVDAYLLLLYG